MVVNAEMTVKQVFILEEDQLKKLHDLIHDRIANPTISIECRDHIVRQYQNAADLFEYENSKKRGIDSLSIRARSEDWEREASIRFKNDSLYTFSLNLRGPEDLVSTLKDEIIEIVDGLRPWYWWIRKIDFFYVSFAIGFLIYFILNTYADSLPRTNENEFNLGITIFVFFLLVSIIGLFVLSMWGLSRLVSRFFPLAVFCLGQEKRRYETDEKIRWGIIVAFFVSLLASVGVSFLM